MTADTGLLAGLAQVLPHLRRGLDQDGAEALLDVVRRHVSADAVGVISEQLIAAFAGAGSDHHLIGTPYRTALVGRSIAEGRVIYARGARAVGCAVARCPFTSGVAAPILVHGSPVGAIALLRTQSRPLGGSTRRAAAGIARFVSDCLEHLAEGPIPDDGFVRERLRQELARAQRYERPLAVAVFEAATLPAAEVERHLRERVRAADIVGRLDDRRLAVIQPETDGARARQAVERVRAGLLERLHIALPVGIAAYPEVSGGAEQLITSATPS